MKLINKWSEICFLNVFISQGFLFFQSIALECERFLGPKGYAGFQVSPPNEHANINNPYRPW